MHISEKLLDRFGRVLAESWIERYHGHVIAETVDLLQLPSVDLQRIGVIVCRRVIPVPDIEISRMEEIESLRGNRVCDSLIIGADREDLNIPDLVMPSRLYMQDRISLALRRRAAVQDIADMVILVLQRPDPRRIMIRMTVGDKYKYPLFGVKIRQVSRIPVKDQY